MENDLFVSIIVPVYNTPFPLLKSCLDSVFYQTYNNYELIIIDDGSSQECASEIDKLSAVFINKKVIHKTNEGVSIARNLGLKLAIAKHVLFLDSDNTLPLDTLENYSKYESDYDIIIGQSILLGRKIENNKDIIEYYNYKNKNHGISKKVITKEDWSNLISHIISGKIPELSYEYGYYADGPCEKLYKTEIAKTIDFPHELKWDEDTVWLLNYLLNSKKGLIIPDYTYNNISYQFSATKRFRENCIIEFNNVCNFELQLCKRFPDNTNDFYIHNLRNCLLVIRTYFFHVENNKRLKEKYLEFRAWIHSEQIQHCFYETKYIKSVPFLKQIIIRLIIRKNVLLLFVLLFFYSVLKRQ